MTEQEQQSELTLVEPETEPEQPETPPEEPSPDELKKTKRLAQLRNARVSKAAKKKQKEEEDTAVRAALLRLTEENKALKRKREEPQPEEPEVEVKVQVEEPKNKRVRVTRRPTPTPTPEPTQQSGGSFAQQVAITSIVGALGLASWYTQNRLFQEPPKKTTAKTTTKTTNKTPQQPPSQTKKKPQKPSLFGGAPQRTKKRIGASGFTM